VIAGAGIGGLTAGASLLQAGHDVTIFEQASELSEIGAGLGLTAERARQIEAGALGKLRAALSQSAPIRGAAT